jgi:hypothetical protein
VPFAREENTIIKKLLVSLIAVGCLQFELSSYAQVPGIINYQGRIVDNGTNFDGTGLFEFALVNPGGTTNYWSNDGSAAGQPSLAVSLTVTKGLYSVLLGDTTISNMTVAVPAAVFANSNVLLRVWFNDGVNGFQQLTPDQRIAAVGFSMMAANVPDGSITSNKLAAGAVGPPALGAGLMTASAISNNFITASQASTISNLAAAAASTNFVNSAVAAATNALVSAAITQTNQNVTLGYGSAEQVLSVLVTNLSVYTDTGANGGNDDSGNYTYYVVPSHAGCQGTTCVYGNGMGDSSSIYLENEFNSANIWILNQSPGPINGTNSPDYITTNGLYGQWFFINPNTGAWRSNIVSISVANVATQAFILYNGMDGNNLIMNWTSAAPSNQGNQQQNVPFSFNALTDVPMNISAYGHDDSFLAISYFQETDDIPNLANNPDMTMYVGVGSYKNNTVNIDGFNPTGNQPSLWLGTDQLESNNGGTNGGVPYVSGNGYWDNQVIVNDQQVMIINQSDPITGTLTYGMLGEINGDLYWYEQGNLNYPVQISTFGSHYTGVVTNPTLWLANGVVTNATSAAINSIPNEQVQNPFTYSNQSNLWWVILNMSNGVSVAATTNHIYFNNGAISGGTGSL